MQADLEEALIDAVYRAAVDAQAWPEVMRLTAQAFPSSAQTFYFLDRAPRHVRPVALTGIELSRLPDFDGLYFAADNPWMRVSDRLHRPGVVRTNERLAEHLHDDRALYRSAYFNEWMRPQRLRYTIGNTLLADERVIVNVTLMRPPDMPTFDAGEVGDFERLSRHMTRALRLAQRFEEGEASLRRLESRDGPQVALGLVDAELRLLQANAALDRLLGAGRGLRLQGGALRAATGRSQQQLSELVAAVLQPADRDRPEPLPLTLEGGAEGAALVVRALPARRADEPALPWPATALLRVSPAGGRGGVAAAWLRRLYGLTHAEARLVAHLTEGLPLKAAAVASGLRYESARTLLKIVFGKLDVHSQSQLMARVMADRP